MSETRDSQDLIRELLVRELETVNLYVNMTASAQTPGVRELLARITEQEKHHIAEAMDLLARFDAGQAEALRIAGVELHHEERPTTDERRPVSTAPVQFEPSGTVVQAPPDAVLLVAAKDAGIPIRNVCGGHGKCGTCRIEVLTGDEMTSPVTDAERRLLDGALDQGWRLACQTRVFGPLRVRVPSVAQETEAEAAK